MKNLLSITLFILLALVSNGQKLQLKLGSTYSSYSGKPLGGWQFGAYAGLDYNVRLGSKTALKFEGLVTQRGSKTPGRWWIFETCQFKTDYAQIAVGLEVRPVYHLSFAITPYYARMVRAQTTKWNYKPYTWNVNFAYKNEFGAGLNAEYHFKDIKGKEAPISIQAAWNMAATGMAANGFEMHNLRNIWGSLGFAFKII